MSAETLARLTSDVRSGRADPLQLVEDALLAADEAGGVFWELARERARADARARARERARADAGASISPGVPPRALDGVPVAVKDAFAVSGMRQHLGLAREVVSDHDAIAVRRLRDAGAVVIGTTAMDQLAWTMTGQAPGYPVCDNPLVPGHSPGGSSGGAAAAVAAGIVPLALGADSAGSVRVPAAWCGVVGFKPSHGEIDLGGCAPLAPCLDTAGILARHVDDCRIAFAALSSVESERSSEIASPRIGVPAVSGCDEEVLTTWASTLDRLRRAGVGLTEVDAAPQPRGIGTVFAANLAARWGDVVDDEPAEHVHPDVRAGVEHGRGVTVRDYLAGCDALAAARRRAASLFDDVDLLALPTAPILPPPLDDLASVGVASAFTRVWSAFGWPAISIPSERPGCGIQLVARSGDDARLLSWAAELQPICESPG